jgi:phosphoenolpyruvate carboxykinase (ATP)
MEVLQTHPQLEALGFRNLNQVYWQLHTPQLYEQAVRRQEGFVAHLGPLVVRTGDHTGRSPKDRYIVHEPTTRNDVWWGEINQSFSIDQFDALLQKVLAYYQGKNAFVQNVFACADESYRIGVRVITETAWHNLFVRNMFIRPTDAELEHFNPDFTIIHAPNFHALPQFDSTNSSAFVLIHFADRKVLIGGTSYAGEIKKSIFSVLNYLLPKQGVLPMHCSANKGDEGDTALFFGLSGTGKTTLSSDSTRTLIGDDEHGWSDRGVFNFEGGCYAKVIRLSPTGEPEIYQTTRRFGTILENVSMDMNNRRLDLDDEAFTENTRASYPINYIPNATRTGLGGHPQHIVFLTADSFGVLPPVSKLTPDQAMYHFLSGYTARVAGTEKGVKEPQATFSACFGAPFMPLHPRKYAALLGEKIRAHGSEVWLVNTGWTGGPFGVGQRMKLSHTRSMIRAILDGTLAQVESHEDPIFGVRVPDHCPGIPDEVLNQRHTWADPDAYDEQARSLAARFVRNFKQYADIVAPEVAASGPREA